MLLHYARLSFRHRHSLLVLRAPKEESESRAPPGGPSEQVVAVYMGRSFDVARRRRRRRGRRRSSSSSGKILPMTDSPTAGEEVEKSFCRPASWEITRVSSVLFPARELPLSEWLLPLYHLLLLLLGSGACRPVYRSVGRSVHRSFLPPSVPHCVLSFFLDS